MSTWKLASPATLAKLEANRANAQHSTGPRTAEGKARSSQNARTHGLSARELVIRPEERADFDDFLGGFTSDLRPEGALEETIFAETVHAAWNLRRVRVLEAELFNGEIDPLLDEQNEAKLDRLSRYAQRFERTLHRAVNTLRQLQTERAARAVTQSQNLPPLANARQVHATKRTQAVAATERVRTELTLLDLETGRTAIRLPHPRPHVSEPRPQANGIRAWTPAEPIR